MFNKLKKFLKSKRAVGSVATAIKVGTACVLGAAVLVGGISLHDAIFLPEVGAKVSSVASYEGGEAGGGAVGGVTPVSVPAAYDPIAPELNPTDGSWEGGRTTPQTNDKYNTEDYEYCYYNLPGICEGWTVLPHDRSKTSYQNIFESINGEPVVDLCCTFSDCTNLTNAPIIPVSVTNICTSFDSCPNLSEVSYAGTIEQWNSIEKDGWNAYSPITVVHCSDGDINL